MSNEKGITLISLIIYVVVMTIVLIIMGSIVTNFYSNTESTFANVKEAVEFNKFNIYFLKEVKLYDNAIDTINLENDTPYILFTSGNAFIFDNNKIYYNNIEICDGVKNISFAYGTTVDESGKEIEDTTVIKADLSFEKFSKSMNYKIENIY